MGTKEAKNAKAFAEGTLATSAIDLGEDLLGLDAAIEPLAAPETLLEPSGLDPPAAGLQEQATVVMSSGEPTVVERPEGPGPGPGDAMSSEVDSPLESALGSARILASEGLYDRAKSVLRREILRDPANLSARKMLEEIQEEELRRILSRPFGGGRRTDRARAEGIEDRLWLDLALGIGPDGDDARQTAHRVPVNELGAALEIKLPSLGPKDRVDAGIALLELGAASLAARVLATARSMPEVGDEAAALHVWALLAAGHAFEAALAAEACLEDTTLGQPCVIEMQYLLGRAEEALGKTELALVWYRQVAREDAGYRDAAERIVRLGARNRT